MIDYNIIATGSKGNAVVIDQKILIDCGVSFKVLSKSIPGVEAGSAHSHSQ
jgi:hypothetical protein